jgi:phosphoribosyl 1,2-cyclic phosphodiesterase
LSANGHLSNQDSAQYLSSLIGLNTKSILLAHLSSEANTERHALEELVSTLESSQNQINPNLVISCAKQNEPVTGGSL